MNGRVKNKYSHRFHGILYKKKVIATLNATFSGFFCMTMHFTEEMLSQARKQQAGKKIKDAHKQLVISSYMFTLKRRTENKIIELKSMDYVCSGKQGVMLCT